MYFLPWVGVIPAWDVDHLDRRLPGAAPSRYQEEESDDDPFLLPLLPHLQEEPEDVGMME